VAEKPNQDEDVAVLRVGEGPALREDEIDGWHRLHVACAEADQGKDREDLPARERTAAELRSASPGGRSLRWAARDAGGRTVGGARLRLPDGGGAHGSAGARIDVHPAYRGQGVGTALLAAVRAEAVADGRDSLALSAGVGTAAEQALTAWGFTPGARLVRLRLEVAGCDQQALRATVKAASEGYQLARWQGVAPADLATAYAQARNVIADVPVEGAEWVRAPWDEARLRGLAEDHAASGDALLTVAALYPDEHGQEAVAGFSEIVLPGGAGPLARQSDTAVVRSHRGRGLGLWVKAAMLQWLLGAHPEVSAVVTQCLETNHHMIAINERLGFRTVGREQEFRLALA
jgi:GNAT superfamily N-acetyltransferase